jgi:UDP-N-acetylglucosamine--N-acetylmuramyl-(pentapeptide) pyrophosphoryl-undecaprenol N-acetylglucosamine transferase
VYPALAIAEAILRHRPDSRLSFVGSVDGFERPLIAEAGISFDTQDEVRAGPLHGVPLGQRLVSMAQLALGTIQSWRLIGRLKPDALLLTGGWVGLPVALAARLRGVPSLIFLPDIEPGLSIRVLRRFARRVAITVPESAQYFAAGQTVVTGYPLRQQMEEATREKAIAHFALDPARKTLLVFGGSRGARSINNALLAILPDLLADGLQIIHVTGTLDWDDLKARRDALPDATHYHAFPYLHGEMGLAFAAADLAVSRAGASTLGEFPHFGLPSILVPYPYAWRYQKVNADALAEQGAAVVMNDADMERDLLPAVRALLNDPARLDAMARAARALAQPEGAWRVGQELLRLAGAQA